MNSLWNKNIDLFRKRFPALSSLLENKTEAFADGSQQLFETESAKNNSTTAKAQGMLLHSKYNPEREAQQLIDSFNPEKNDTAVFLSFGLGYAPDAFAKKYSSKKIILIEPDSSFLFAAFCLFDWTDILNHKDLVFAVEATELETAAIISRLEPERTQFYSTPSQTAHAAEYFTNVNQQLKKQQQKKEINSSTLERFAKLWLRNSCRNLKQLYGHPGINVLKHKTTLPFVILAAGPSLETVLPYLEEIKKRAVIVCVESALHACLKAKVQPDFIMLLDPQYACWQHIEFLSSPDSVLVTEPGVYPSVFNFKCRSILLSSSLYPVAAYFEERTEHKGKIEAGGSVTTSAWDFARFCGAREIYVAGMDLGFPGGQTHIRGSQFEEKIHTSSTRTVTAEAANLGTLTSAGLTVSKDYNGGKILTDKRMSLFSWWFESNCGSAEQNGIHTFTLTPQGLYIKNITPCKIQTLLEKKEMPEERKKFLKLTEEFSTEESKKIKEKFEKAFLEFTQTLNALEETARKGMNLCDSAIKNTTKTGAVLSELEAIDRKILQSEGKNVAALVFPTQRQLEEKSRNLPSAEPYHSLYSSRLVYSELLSAIREYKQTLRLE